MAVSRRPPAPASSALVKQTPSSSETELPDAAFRRLLDATNAALAGRESVFREALEEAMYTVAASGLPDGVETGLERLAALDSVSPSLRARALAALALSRARHGDYADAVRAYEEAAALDETPEQRRSLQAQSAMLALENGEVAQAISLAQQVLEDDKEHPQALVALGRANLERGDTHEAIEIGRQLMPLLPAEGRALITIGLAQEGGLDSDPGLLEALITNPPGDQWLLTGIGEVLLDRDRPEDAVRVLDRITDPSPTAARARGWAYFLTERYDLAAADLEIWTSVEPDPWFAAVRGEAIRMNGDLAAAAAVFAEVPADEAPLWMWSAWADALTALDEQAGAVRVLEQGIALHPDTTELLLSLAELLLDEPDGLDRAEALAMRVLEREPRNGQAHALHGETLRRREHFKEAVAAFDRALELIPDYSYAKASKAQTLVELGDVTGGLELLSEAATAIGAEQWIIDMLVEIAERHRPDTVDSVLRRLQHDLQEQGADVLEVCVRRAQLAERQRRWTDADRHYTRARAADPENVGLVLGHSRVLQRLGRFEAALTLIDALPAEPAADQAVVLERVDLLWRLGRLEECRSELERLVQQADPPPTALAGLADLSLGEGRRAEAIELSGRALAADPDHAYALTTAATALLEDGQVDRARERLSQAIALDPEYGSALSQLVYLESEYGSADAIEALLEHLNRITSPDSDILYARGYALYRLGRLDAALSVLESCLTELGPDPNLLDLLGWVQLALGQSQRAVHSFVSFAMDAETPSAKYRALGGVLEADGWDDGLAMVSRAYRDNNPARFPMTALLWSHLGAWDAAARFALHTHRTMPPEESWAHLVPRALRLAGREREALPIARELHELWPTSVDVLAQLAECLWDTRSDDEAAVLERLIVDRVDRHVYLNGSDLNQKAWCLYRLGQLTESGQIFLSALSADNWTSVVLFNLVLVSLLRQDSRQAEVLLRRGIDDLAGLTEATRRGILGVALDDLAKLGHRLSPDSRAQAARFTTDLQAEHANLGAVYATACRQIPLTPAEC